MKQETTEKPSSSKLWWRRGSFQALLEAVSSQHMKTCTEHPPCMNKIRTLQWIIKPFSEVRSPNGFTGNWSFSGALHLHRH